MTSDWPVDKKLCRWKVFNKKRKITGTWIFHSVTDDFPMQTKNCGREVKIFSEHKRTVRTPWNDSWSRHEWKAHEERSKQTFSSMKHRLSACHMVIISTGSFLTLRFPFFLSHFFFVMFWSTFSLPLYALRRWRWW